MAKNRPADPPAAPEPDPVVLRGAPKAVTRISRRMVVIVASLLSGAILGATMFALKAPPPRKDPPGQELVNPGKRQPPDGLAALPKTYGDMAAPHLGAPLPGDLGPAVVAQERTLGLAPPAPPGGAFRPNPVEDAARADALRVAQQGRQAAEAGVLYQTTQRRTEPPKAGATAPAVAMPPAERPAATAEPDPNGQRHKQDFLARKPEQGIYNPHSLQDPLSPHEVLAGTVIAASLITGLNSDLPGFVTAQVTENVFDTVTGQTLLIPQGARLIGKVDSVVAYGQRRALVAWQRIVMPDGSSVLIDNLPATDTAGYTGLEDGVDFHTWQLVKGIALSTLLAAPHRCPHGFDPAPLSGLTEELMKLAKLPDRTPVRITIALTPELNARLAAYTAHYRATYGTAEPVAALIPAMLEAFLAADKGFAKASKAAPTKEI
jgi:type IV secretion system protein VirB10